MSRLMIKTLAAAGALALSLCIAGGAFAADDKKTDDKIEVTPFPADAHVEQVTHVAGKTINYTATVGSLPVRDETGKKVAEVVFTAYTLDGPRDPNRPVTFAFNG